MGTRPVKDARDLETNEKIYFIGHAKATYMSSGKSVEEAINNIIINGGGGSGEGGALTEEQIIAMGFTKNQGTITEVRMNGVSKGTSGVVDLGSVITSHQDISGKQDKLESGVNIKTINGEPILGGGNIVVESGGGDIKEVYIGDTQPTDDNYDLWIDEDATDDSFSIDENMSDTSTNPVQNRVVKSYIDEMVGSIASIVDIINGEVI